MSLNLERENADNELLRLLKAGDKLFLEMLFDKHYTALCNYARVLVKTPQLSEDIIQETIISIWEQRETIEVEKSFQSYLYRCVHNNCVNNLKKTESFKRLKERVSSQVLLQNELANRNQEPEALKHLFEQDTENSLNKIIDELPDQCRKIFLMSRFEYLEYEQIARKLGISVNTVKTQMKRALTKLRKDFNK